MLTSSLVIKEAYNLQSTKFDDQNFVFQMLYKKNLNIEKKLQPMNFTARIKKFLNRMKTKRGQLCLLIVLIAVIVSTKILKVARFYSHIKSPGQFHIDKVTFDDVSKCLELHINTHQPSSLYYPLHASLEDASLEFLSEELNSSIVISMDDLVFDKGRPFGFKARIKLENISVTLDNILSFLKSNIKIRLEYYLKVRFCYITYYFDKDCSIMKPMNLLRKPRNQKLECTIGTGAKGKQSPFGSFKFLDSNYLLRNFVFDENIVKFDLVTNKDSSLCSLVKQLTKSVKIGFGFAVGLGSTTIAKANIRLSNNFSDAGSFENIVSFDAAFEKNIAFSKDDLECLKIKLENIERKEGSIFAINGLLRVEINFKTGMLCFMCENRKLFGFKFGKGGSDYDIEHEFSELGNKMFVQIKSKCDISELGSSRILYDYARSPGFEYKQAQSRINDLKSKIEERMAGLLADDGEDVNVNNVRDVFNIKQDSKLVSKHAHTRSPAPQETVESFLAFKTPELSIRFRNSNIRAVTTFHQSTFLIFPKSGKKFGILCATTAAIVKKIEALGKTVAEHYLKDKISIEINDSIKFDIVPESFTDKPHSAKRPTIPNPVNTYSGKEQAKPVSFVFLPLDISFSHRDDGNADYLGIRLKHQNAKNCANFVCFDFLQNFGFQERQRRSVVNGAGKKMIRNIFKAKRISLTANCGSMAALMGSIDDFELVVAYNGEDVGCYLNSPTDIKFNFALPDRKYDNPADFTSDFLQDSALGCLVDFVVAKGLKCPAANANDEHCLIENNQINLNVGMSHAGDKDKVRCALQVPFVTFNLPSNIHLDLYDTLAVESEDFSLNLSIKKAQEHFEVVFDCSWKTDIDSRLAEYSLKAQNRVVFDFCTSGAEIFDRLGRLIKFLSQSAGIKTGLWEFDYDKNEIGRMNFRDNDVFANSQPPQPQSEDGCPPVLDLEALALEYIDDNFTGEVKVWSDKIAKNIGNCIYSILQNLHPRKLNNSLSIHLKIENLLSVLYVEDRPKTNKFPH